MIEQPSKRLAVTSTRAAVGVCGFADQFTLRAVAWLIVLCRIPSCQPKHVPPLLGGFYRCFSHGFVSRHLRLYHCYDWWMQ